MSDTDIPTRTLESNPTPPDSLAGSNPTSPDSLAGSNLTPPHSQAGSNPTPPDSPAGSNPTPPDSQAGSNPTPPDSPAGSNPTPPDSQAGSNPTPPDSPAGSNPTPPDSQAGSNPTPPDSQAGSNQQAGEATTLASTPVKSKVQIEAKSPSTPDNQNPKHYGKPKFKDGNKKMMVKCIWQGCEKFSKTDFHCVTCEPHVALHPQGCFEAYHKKRGVPYDEGSCSNKGPKTRSKTSIAKDDTGTPSRTASDKTPGRTGRKLQLGADRKLECYSGQLPFNIREWDRRLELIEFKLFEILNFKVESSIQFDERLAATGVVSRSVSVSRPLKFFNYFLLDPRELDHIKQSHSIHTNFRAFIQSVFYIGKGTGERPKEHLKEAKKETDKGKLKKIREIWDDKRRVVILQVFEGKTSEEACTREACMIDAIGLKRLINKNKGSYKIETTPPVEWKTIGLHLLYTSMLEYCQGKDCTEYGRDLNPSQHHLAPFIRRHSIS